MKEMNGAGDARPGVYAHDEILLKSKYALTL